MKKTINESQLRQIVAESVKRVLDDQVAQGKSDTKKYIQMLPKQAKHLAQQIEFFNKTLYHAYPSERKGVAGFREDLQLLLNKALYMLEDIYTGERQYDDPQYY